MRESQSIELKSSWRDEHLKWISGFANAQGGKLVIGKSDDGKVVGVPDVDRLLVDIPNKVVNILGIVVAVNRKGRAGNEYLEIVVKPHEQGISYKGEYYLRSGSTNQLLRGAALDRFLLKKQGLRWDSVPVPNVTARSLDGQSIRMFQEEARLSERVPAALLKIARAALLEKLHLTVGHGDRVRIKRAGVLLFHPEPERYIPGAYVKVGFFGSEGEILYHDEIRGSLFMQMKRTMDLLHTKYTRGLVSFRGIHRVETYPVPQKALREAVINALVHRDYAATGATLIRVTEDRIRIMNSAVLPDGWTAATLLGPHASQAPNPGIADVFFRAGMIEAWGGGIELMRSECEAHGTPEPELHYDSHTMRLEFPFAPEYMLAAGVAGKRPGKARARAPAATTPDKPPRKPPGKTPGKTPVETPVETPGKTPGKTRGRAPKKTPEIVLAIVAGQPTITVPEVAIRVGKSESAILRAIAKLAAAGRLRRVGSRKAGHWEVIR